MGIYFYYLLFTMADEITFTPVQSNEGGMMCGGYGAWQNCTDAEIAIANNHRADVEGQMGSAYSEWNPTQFQSQVVAGMNYNFTVAVNGGTVSFSVFQPLGNAPTQFQGPALFMETPQMQG